MYKMKNNLKLRLLLREYKNEMAKGNLKHIKDSIAVMTLLDAYANLEYVDFSLARLMRISDKNFEYKVPRLERIEYLKNKYKKLLKRDAKYIVDEREKAATTWIEMMIRTEIISEGQIINPNDYILSDFISDNRIIEMYENSTATIQNPNPTFKKSKKIKHI